MKLGEIIKQYRKDHGYNMEEFAKKCGVSKAYISILERDCNPVNGKPVVPSIKTIKSVATAIGKDVNDVFSMLDPEQLIDLGIDDMLTSEQEKEFDDAYTEAAKSFYSAMLNKKYATEICNIVVNKLDGETLKSLLPIIQQLSEK